MSKLINIIKEIVGSKPLAEAGLKAIKECPIEDTERWSKGISVLAKVVDVDVVTLQLIQRSAIEDYLTKKVEAFTAHVPIEDGPCQCVTCKASNPSHS